MIKIIAFDLDDTLYNATWLSQKSRLGGLKKMKELGLDLDVDKAMVVLNQIVKELGSNSVKHYNVLLERMKSLPDIVENKDFSIAKYVAAGVMGYHSVKVRYLKPYRDVRSILENLKSTGFQLAVFSEGIAVKQYEKLLRMKVADFFDFVFISEEINLHKPDSAFFEYCISNMHVNSEEVLYIGDRMDRDIIPAKKVGMKTVLIHRGGKYDMSPAEEPHFSSNGKITPDFEIQSLHELEKILKTN